MFAKNVKESMYNKWDKETNNVRLLFWRPAEAKAKLVLYRTKGIHEGMIIVQALQTFIRRNKER